MGGMEGRASSALGFGGSGQNAPSPFWESGEEVGDGFAIEAAHAEGAFGRGHEGEVVREAEGEGHGGVEVGRGQILGQDVRGNANVVSAMVPLANMFGYVNNLRSFSQGRASYTMQFDSYQQTPGNVQEEIIKRVRGE